MQEVKQAIHNKLSSCQSMQEMIQIINDIKEILHKLSPQKEPVDCVRWIHIDKVRANEYNPNQVASPELALLYTSIKSDGYTQPVVAYQLEDGSYEIVDGYHRNRIAREYQDINQRVHGYLPVVVIDKSLDERIGSTIRHNRARGSHQIRSMSNIVIDLVKAGWEDDKICEKLGMDRDEVLRLKQVSGLQEAFANHVFSKSWEEFEERNFPDEKGEIKKTIANRPVRKNAK